jgi:hypothetical protein
MLQVNLAEPDKQIARRITGHCCKYGTVVSVAVHRSPTPFALVEMANHMQTLELAGSCRGSTFGTSVLIHLRQTLQ